MKKEKTKEHIVYCGPTIIHVAKQFTVYEEIPEALQELAAKCTPIGALLVPLSKFAATKRALGDPSSKEAILYGHIQKQLKGGK